jgi:hypothetical protein
LNELILYFDESGFTGENLLSKDQHTFAYGSVNIQPDKAQALVSRIIEKYKIQNGELKALKLIRRDKGQKAILEILDEISNDIKISIDDKKFALSCYFFEYIFEPILASKSTIFYQLNFHKYISNVIYISFVNNDRITNKILNIFEKLMRKKELNHLDEIIAILHDEQDKSETLEFFEKILLFINIHKNTIYQEIESLPSWTIDLSMTSLHSLFCEWGATKQEIKAFCDSSKPIDAQKSFFDNFIGREDIVYSPFIANEGNPVPLTYNLKEITMVDSKEHPGVQLADIVATATAYSFQMYQEHSEFIEKLREVLKDKIVYASVFPDFSYIDLKNKNVQLNALIFDELIKRSIEGIPVLDNIEEYIYHIEQLLEETPMSFED